MHTGGALIYVIGRIQMDSIILWPICNYKALNQECRLHQQLQEYNISSSKFLDLMYVTM